MQVRDAAERELNVLAQLWYDGWQDGHRAIVPPELVRVRTLDSFRDRLRAALGSVRVTGPEGAPSGFCMIKADELYQLFVARHARGSGAAAILLADGEARLAANGIRTAWLACAIGNDRAARFYEKSGWRRTGTITLRLETVEGVFMLDVWRYEKTLSRGGVAGQPGSERP